MSDQTIKSDLQISQIFAIYFYNGLNYSSLLIVEKTNTHTPV